MDKKLGSISFANIFKDSLPNVISPIPHKAFEACIKDYQFPYLKEEEKNCIKDYTQKYLFSMDQILLKFSKNLI